MKQRIKRKDERIIVPHEGVMNSEHAFRSAEFYDLTSKAIDETLKGLRKEGRGQDLLEIKETADRYAAAFVKKLGESPRGMNQKDAEKISKELLDMTNQLTLSMSRVFMKENVRQNRIHKMIILRKVEEIFRESVTSALKNRP